MEELSNPMMIIKMSHNLLNDIALRNLLDIS